MNLMILMMHSMFVPFVVIMNEWMRMRMRAKEIFANESNLNNNECVAYDRIKKIYVYIQ